MADQFFVYENMARDKMIKKGFNGEKIHVVYNSLDFEIQLNIFNQLELVEKPSIIFKNNLPTLFFIGRLTLKKKIDQLIQAVIGLNKKQLSYNLLIIGECHGNP